jgi:hypothetical protein
MNNESYSNSIIDLIKARTSWRSFTSESLGQTVQDNILEFLLRQHTGPLNSRVRFELIKKDSAGLMENNRLHTYGFVKNAGNFIVGAVKISDNHWIDYGYLLEKIILKMTDLGLGTCWLGGTFSRSEFGNVIELRKDEVIPAVTPVGFVTDKRSLRDNIIRWGAKSKNRNSRSTLFFMDHFGKHLPYDPTSNYETVLDMVRFGPSASNRQPWRIVKIENNYHLYVQRTKKYLTLTRETDLQLVDMGIAVCHFELTANELGLKGHWIVNDPKIPVPDLAEYIITWISG